MTIQKATKKDLKKCEEISRLEELSFADGRYPTVAFFEIYLNDSFFLVAKNPEVIGYILGERLKGNEIMIWFFTVEKKSRGKGVGQKLFKAFEKHCKALGVEGFLLYAPTFNNKTVDFYKKQGLTIGKAFFECAKKL